jgi:hypothetical protein
MSLTFMTALTALLLLAVIFELLRRRQLREKYAALWMAVGIVVLVLGLFPRLLDSFSREVGVHSGVSLVLFLGIVFLLMVCIHLSWEANRLEEKARTLAEEVALIRTELRQVTDFTGRADLAQLTKFSEHARPAKFAGSQAPAERANREAAR